MKREDLEQLGLDKEVVDKVMGLYGQSVNQIKADLSAEQAKAKSLEADIKERDRALKDLQEQHKDNADLSDKLANLQQTYEDLKQQSAKAIENLKRDTAIATALAEAKAKDPNLVAKSLDLALIKLNEDGSVMGLKEQLDKLKTTHAYLFDMGTSTERTAGQARKTPNYSSDLATAMRSEDFNLTEYVKLQNQLNQK